MKQLNEKQDWIQIGSGQFGEVYKAICVIDHKQKPLK